jgi:hypothetical protein
LRNAAGGIRLPEHEEKLLWYNVVAFCSKRNYELAYALARGLRRAKDEDIALRSMRLMDLLKKQGAVSGQGGSLKNAWAFSPVASLAHVALLAALPLLLFGLVMLDEVKRTGGGFKTSLNTAGLTPVSPKATDFWHLDSTNPAPAPPSPEPQKPIDLSDLIPQGGRTAPNQAVCARLPKNGQILDGNLRSRSEGHSIEIKNGSQGNAIIKVRDAFSRKLVVSFYVEKGQTASLRGVLDGRYQIQYAVGDKLSQTCRSFVGRPSVNQFPDIESFTMRPQFDGVIFQHLTYTLYTMPGGNVRPQSLDLSSFEAD